MNSPNKHIILDKLALICSISGILLLCIVIGIIPAFIGFILSIICLLHSQKYNKKMALCSLILSIITGILFFVIIIYLFLFGTENTNSTNEVYETNSISSSEQYIATPTPTPTIFPTPKPTVAPTPEHTIAPTPEPTVSPTPEHTVAPTPEHTVAPIPEHTPQPENFTSTSNAEDSTMVWVDDTAKRYHKKNGCGMDNAYQVTLEEAINMGKTPCGRCYK